MEGFTPQEFVSR
jgi:hypothetical protein